MLSKGVLYMPPKIKITKTDIIQKALSLIRENGTESLNARSIAAALGCSTQPIFSNFDTMDALEEAVRVAAYEHYFAFLTKEAESGKYPTYKAFGMAYIRFAKEEKELFRLLFMCDRSEKEMLSVTPPDFEASIEMIMKANDISREKATLMHLEMWACVHGIATMLATSFLALDWELISTMVSDVYQGTRAKHISEENKQ